jgi:hypothetical protein
MESTAGLSSFAVYLSCLHSIFYSYHVENEVLQCRLPENIFFGSSVQNIESKMVARKWWFVCS